MYALAVQGAFELINEGYNILTTSGSASSATTGANSDMNVNSMNRMGGENSDGEAAEVEVPSYE